jgi:Vault protein inter-alpha-trypsin domain
MRTLRLLALLSFAAAPAEAQGIAVPVGCGGCASGALRMDSLRVSGTLANGSARIYVDHIIHNPSDNMVDAAFFFPLPEGAQLTQVSVFEGSTLEQYNQWSGPDESRWIQEGIARERPDAELHAYAGMNVVHVRIPSIPARGTQRVQLAYTQPLRAERGTLGFRYPLSAGAAASPIGSVELVLTVETEAGFDELGSPSHDVRVELGSEMARCPPQARCGFRGVPSRRNRVVRFTGGGAAQARDFELLYTPSQRAASSAIP